MTWTNWIQLVEIPALATLAVMFLRLEARLTAFQVRAAEHYATKDGVESRLDRLESKIDRLAERVSGGHD